MDSVGGAVASKEWELPLHHPAKLPKQSWKAAIVDHPTTYQHNEKTSRLLFPNLLCIRILIPLISLAVKYISYTSQMQQIEVLKIKF